MFQSPLTSSVVIIVIVDSVFVACFYSPPTGRQKCFPNRWVKRLWVTAAKLVTGCNPNAFPGRCDEAKARRHTLWAVILCRLISISDSPAGLGRFVHCGVCAQ